MGFTKRKRRSSSKNLDDKTSSKKLLSDSKELLLSCPLDFSSPKKVFETFIYPLTVEEFFSKYWEKQPLVLHRSESLPTYGKYATELFSKAIFEKLLVNEKLKFVTDVNVVKCTAEKQRLNLNKEGRVTVQKFHHVFNEHKGTMQIHQPQRFQNNLWQLLENLESYFWCLVGANVYMTPADAQGLPPHHDDVEVFILQLEGSKRWRLYKPLVELPRDYSDDLTENEIGVPTHDFVLQPGDFLYFPRGTIHQADTSGSSSDEYSTHITISTYQRHTWGDYLQATLPNLLEEFIDKDVSFRRGLPYNFLRAAELSESPLDLLLKKLKYNKYLAPEEMIADFMYNRLPPFCPSSDTLHNSLNTKSMPRFTSKVRLKFHDHVSYFLKKEIMFDESDEDSDDETETSCNKNHSQQLNFNQKRTEAEVLIIYFSIVNSRERHMMGNVGNGNTELQESNSLKFPSQYIEGMNFLKSNLDRFVSASDIPLKSKADVEKLIQGLWSSSLLDVQLGN